jgi:AcrR family transcriptional regulator
MTQAQTITSIRNTAKHLFASEGYEGLSMRILASASGVGISSIYHFFTDKDVLLKDIFDRTNTFLGDERLLLRKRATAEHMLRDRIDFQFEHMEDVVFVLKYYLHYRQDFMALPGKILPPKAYLHIEEVLHKGISTGEFSVANNQLETQAKIITHSINGFLLEYYPEVPRGTARKELVGGLTEFIMRSLKYKEVPMR